MRATWNLLLSFPRCGEIPPGTKLDFTRETGRPTEDVLFLSLWQHLESPRSARSISTTHLLYSNTVFQSLWAKSSCWFIYSSAVVGTSIGLLWLHNSWISLWQCIFSFWSLKAWRQLMRFKGERKREMKQMYSVSVLNTYKSLHMLYNFRDVFEENWSRVMCDLWYHSVNFGKNLVIHMSFASNSSPRELVAELVSRMRM